MSISRLDSAAAVEAALDEFDELGRDAFLDSYGFDRSRDYFVVARSRLYDSKAVAGVAFGIQFPEEGALPASEFTGGAQTVGKVLGAMGYDVRQAGIGRLNLTHPWYKFAAIVAALDVQRDGRFDLQSFQSAFGEVVRQIDPGAAEKWWEPLFHLTRDGVWELRSGDERASFEDLAQGRPKSAASVRARADKAEFVGGYRARAVLQPGEFQGDAKARLERASNAAAKATDIPRSEAVEAERSRRAQLWQRLCGASDPERTTSRDIGAAGIRPASTGQGIFRDVENTSHLGPHGVTLALYIGGAIYDDQFDPQGGTYRYPQSSDRGSRDANEVAATKAAKHLELPVFLVTAVDERGARRVDTVRVDDYDDDQGAFLLTFEDVATTTGIPPKAGEAPVGSARERRSSTRLARPGQQRFRFEVLKHHGIRCALCGLALEPLIEAAHIVGVANDGVDSPSNGLPLCRNHHRAFDLDLIAIDPDGLRVVSSPTGPSLDALGVKCTRIEWPAGGVAIGEAVQRRWVLVKRTWGKSST